jgi:hypothetical protein
MEIKGINKFWQFFETIAPQILDNPEDLELINSLDKEVDKLGKISWEYGALNDDCDLYFCLSPNFKFDLIPFVEFAISLSPHLPNWEFISGKPQKLKCVEEFTFINDDETESIISTKNWYAVAYQFKDDTYDIDFVLDTSLDEETSYLALDTAMINLLGEINYMRKVNAVKIVNEFEPNTNKKGIHFTKLAEIIV